LFIVAFIASYTARVLKRNRDKLYRQNRELELTAVKARESDRLKSEFLANVSHEVRTPLNAIIGFSELLKDECLGTLNDRQREAVSDINSSGTHLLSLINDLLDLSKVEVGKMELHLSEIGLKPLLERSLSAFGQKIQENGLKVSADFTDCPEVIRADERKVTQILYNLLSNAVKFTPAGGAIGLSARSYTRREGRWMTKYGKTADLPISLDGDGTDHPGVVEVCVSDTGIGLKGEDLERIFNPFEQVDGSLSRRYQGTGLGLSLTKRFVELHHGQIWAESGGENQGSAFHFVIPL
jgi:signal transduction histidine kinase